MRKLINIAIVIFIVVVLLGAAAAGYLWYTTKRQVDQIVTMAKPFAEISYGGIDVSPNGSVGVRRVRIVPNSTNDAITIGAIRLNAPNFMALLHIRWQLSRDQLPEALSLSFQEVELPLGGSILSASSVQAARSSPLDNLEALGCGPINVLGGAEWREMGYDRFVGNIEIGYHVDRRNNVLNLRTDSATRDWATLNLDIGFALTQPPESLMELATSFTPKLAKLNFVLRDDGFNQRRNNYCAAKAGKAVPEFLADHVRLVVERLRANGIVPGPGLIAAYQRYLTEDGALTLTATPPAPINPAELNEYAPADVVKLLGLTLKVNETAVSDLTVDWDAAKVAKALGVEPEPAPEPEPEASPEAPASQTAVVPQKTYHPTPVGELNRHVGKIAKLRTTTGAQYRGQLDAIAEGIVRITVRKSGGSATLSLRASEITAAEVFY
jgi:NAD(P)-dependent dehydrogenase (short-subunit alcohol dehydrogenase family)